ncbi:MAG: hypothetical protein V4501_07205 [Pseudomonadota bacterium]
MHIFKIASSSILALSLVNPAFAGLFTPKDCPTVEQIQAKIARESPVTRCDNSGNCTYDINSSTPIYTIDGWERTAWLFFMDLKATSEDDAKNKAAQALQSLTLASGPTFETNTLYFCRYNTIEDVDAIAVYY